MKTFKLGSVLSAITLLLVLGVPDFGEAAGKGKPGGSTQIDPAIVYVAVSSSGPYNELAVANADGSNQTALLSSDQVGYFFPAWSPVFNSEPGFQGSVVFEQWSGSVAAPFIELKIIDVTVTSSGLVIGTPQELVPNASAAAWSPQGDKIAYVTHGSNQNGIYVRHLTSPPVDTLVIPNENAKTAGWPAWNPEGTHLAYTWNDDSQGKYSVRIKEVVQADGNVIDGPEIELVDSVYGASALDWSRGGGFIAFKSGGTMQIVDVSDLTTTLPLDPDLLQDTTWTESPTWMPDTEAELVFMNRNGPSGAGKRRIVRRNLTTQQETVIVERKGYHLYEPDWRR